MKEYIIFYNLIATATNEVHYYETKKYTSKEEAINEYKEDAMNKTTMGIMQMRKAELVTYDKNSKQPKTFETIIDKTK